MLKWAAKKLGVGVVEVHLDDLAEYIELLARAGDEERRLIAAEALALRQALEAQGIAVGAPIDYIRRKPAMLTRLEDYVEDMARKDRIKSLGMAAWMHTLRAARHVVDGQRAEIFRELTLKMWRELGKGLAADTAVGLFPLDFNPANA
ncbi:hypothetical protein [Megalodesulfovibrio gigas]|uniref:Uncharacterized protein n=1 Tax=Megalodesulfovibrio gigas (strain ATCC 19364 / DSM 1382 / NCIMB 9332 / VKM B-1759) TaxID=1121448 RepID=T2GCF0_MEGG1|nr:hypothetical protein [Megalodesulfovibrio gigas]AGW13562.1 hypothetical protein DGI_1750 [Megalodesulfovibrio gigas DSM 1382 = ATCC 19364]